MKAVFGTAQNAHAPTRYLRHGQLVDYPETSERVTRLYAGAVEAEAEFTEPGDFDMAHLLAVHSRRYLDFLEHGPGEWMALPGAFPEITPSVRPLEAVAGYPSHILGRAGWHIMDFAGAVSARTWGSVKTSAFSALTAAELVLGGERAAYALCRPPGHHAYRERASGFCYLNNAAIAAQYLRRKHDRIAILDIDVHHGNGTQSIFYERSEVLTVSIHADPSNYYPFYYGYADQRGVGQGEGFNLNIPLPVKSGDEIGVGAVTRGLNRIAEFKATILVLSLGLDAHEADPLNGGAVTSDGFARMARMIGEFALPTVIIQEGGYLTPMLGGNLAVFLTRFEQ